MKESLWGYWLIMLGIMIAMVMILMQNYTTTNQQDYYLTKEITYAAMYDAIDYGYYKKNGELKIIKEKFVENFIRRFAESATLNKTYTVNFYSIYETPPAVSIEIKTNTGEFMLGNTRESLSITNRLTAILETKVVEPNIVKPAPEKPGENKYEEEIKYFVFPYQSCDGVCYLRESKLQINLEELTFVSDLKKEFGEKFNINKLKFKVTLDGIMENKADYEEYQKYICGGNSCTINNENKETNYTSVPHSVLYKMGSDIEKYFAKYKSAKELTYRRKGNTLDVQLDSLFSCNKTIKEDVGVKQYRIKSENIDKSTMSLNAADGTFAMYDYIYKPNSENYTDIFDTKSQVTPYYNSCLTGFKFTVKYTYDNSK